MNLDIAFPVAALFLALAGRFYLKFKARKADFAEETTPRKIPRQKKKSRVHEPQENPDSGLSAALLLELAAAMLRAGQSLGGMTYELSRLSASETSDVLFEVSRGLSHGLPWHAAWDRAEQLTEGRTPPSIIPLRDCLENLADQGAPTADLLDIVAERHRRLEQRKAEKAAAKLSVKLVVPLGLCSLPAFICWGVVPVMIALLPGVAEAL